MLSRRRGEAWAAPESDYSQSVPKGHRHLWATMRKNSGNGPIASSHVGIALSRRNKSPRDETLFPLRRKNPETDAA